MFCAVDTFDDPVGDPDSGMSTSHSPEENFKQVAGRHDQDTLSPVSPALHSAATRLELLDPTHRGLHRSVRGDLSTGLTFLTKVCPAAQRRDPN